MIKNVTCIFLLVAFLAACKSGNPVNTYETKDWSSANLSLSYARTYAGEQLKIKVNGKVIYQIETDSSLYQGRKLFKLPDGINTVEIESYYKKQKKISCGYRNAASFKRISIIIGYPHPKGIAPTYMRNNEGFLLPAQKKEWFHLPLDLVDRPVYIQPDTVQGQVILEEESMTKQVR